MRNEEQKKRHAEYMRTFAKDGRNGSCSVQGCVRPSYGRTGLCAMHYQRKRKTGSTGEAEPILMQGFSMEERFWAKVNKSGNCWEWTAHCILGYGQFYYEGKERKAHRVAYELLVGPIPEGLQLDHLCRNRKCVNPAHLEPVTNYENWIRGESPSVYNSRKTHCLRGHPLSGDNLKINKRTGYRTCRECLKVSNEASRQRVRERQTTQG